MKDAHFILYFPNHNETKERGVKNEFHRYSHMDLPSLKIERFAQFGLFERLE